MSLRGDDAEATRVSGRVRVAVTGGAARMPTRVGHYELLRKLGAGGMSEVYLARDLRLGRKVALKFLSAADQGLLARMSVEAKALARLQHEHIVSIHGMEWHDGRPYLVLEYVPGRTLDVWLAETHGGRPLPPARTIELITAVLRALVAAHEQGIVHRDLKPSNILISDQGVVKVLDFGVAKVLGAASEVSGAAPRSEISGGLHTEVGARVGTRAFMAPEQWRGAPVDARTDLWAVGVIAYILSAGRHPMEVARLRLESLADPLGPRLTLESAVPGAGLLGAWVDQCLEREPAWRPPSARAALASLERLARPSAPGVAVDEVCPYAGLAAFQENDEGRYFGRERVVQRLAARVEAAPLTTLLGASGAGKSSLVRAGLVPALRRRGARLTVLILRPGATPLDTLAAAVVRAGLAHDTAALMRELVDEPGRLGALLRGGGGDGARALVFVDQLEELVTLSREEQRVPFLACLGAAADDVSSPVRVVLSLRQDFFDKVGALAPELPEALAASIFPLPPPSRDDFRRALEGPLEPSGYRFESPVLVEAMLEQLAELSAPLPALQFAGSLLWERRDRARRVLTMAAFEELEGVRGALAHHATAVLGLMSARERGQARSILTCLVTPERTRAVVSREELARLFPAREASTALERLVDARLLGVQTRADGAFVELAHESLVTHWPMLRGWLDEQDADAQLRSSVMSAARQWVSRDRGEGYLWRGEAAAEALAWRARSPRAATEGLPPDALAFLDAVAALARRQVVVERARRWALVGLAVVMLVVVLVLAADARQEAARARTAATAAREAAMRARDATRVSAARTLTRDPASALMLLRELEGAPPPGWAALAQRLWDEPVPDYVLRGPAGFYDADLDEAAGWAVGASTDGAVMVWDLQAPDARRALVGHLGEVRSVVFLDADRVASAGIDGTLRVWSVLRGTLEATLYPQQGAIRSLSVSAAAHLLATSGMDGSVRLWDSDTLRPLASFGGPAAGVRWVQLSPDGRTLAATTLGQELWVWDVPSGALRYAKRLGGPVTGVAFAPGGRDVAVVDNTSVLLVDARGRTRRELYSQPQGLMNVQFLDQDHILVTASDSTAEISIVDLEGRVVSTYRGHTGVIFRVRPSVGRDYILTPSRDQTVRVWRARVSPTRRPLGAHARRLNALAQDPSGRLLSVSVDGVARRWAAGEATDTPPETLTGFDGQSARHLVASPDGRWLALAYTSGRVDLLRADDLSFVRSFSGHSAIVWSLTFSPDSRALATASGDQTVRVWSLAGGVPSTLRGHVGSVTSVGYSPDGAFLYSTGHDGHLRKWDVARERLVADVVVEPAELYDVAVDPRGRWVATGSSNGRLRRFDAATLEARVLYEAAGNVGVDEGSFSPSGRWLAASTGVHTLLVLDMEGSRAPTYLAMDEEPVSLAWLGEDALAVALADGRLVRAAVPSDPITPDHPALWRRPASCPDLALRREYLGFDDVDRVRDELRCRAKVRGAR